MSGGGTPGARLDALTRELAEQWRQTRESWRDSQAREFDERFLQPLEAAVEAASRSMDELQAILRKIRTDCE